MIWYRNDKYGKKEESYRGNCTYWNDYLILDIQYEKCKICHAKAIYA